MPNYHENDIKNNENYIQSLVKAIAQPIQLSSQSTGPISHFAIPDGFNIVTDARLEEHQAHPNRQKGNITFVDVQSFIDYVNLYKTPETRLYATVNPESNDLPLVVEAIFNENRPHAEAGWRDFSATFVPKPSYEWKVWNKTNKVTQSQFDFAIFIEDNIKDIHQPSDVSGMPSGTDMLNLAMNFDLKQDKQIKSIVRTQSGGTRLDFVDTEDSATQERMEVFNQFAIGIPVFFHGKGYELYAKLRYRQKSQQLIIWYELTRPDLIVDAAVTNMLGMIEQSAGIRPMFI